MFRAVTREEEMATHSRILAWRIPSTEEPGELQSMESQKESDTTERVHRRRYSGRYNSGYVILRIFQNPQNVQHEV